MSAIHIRNVPDVVLQRLKQRAAANHRSMQKEVLSILEAATVEEGDARLVPPIKLVMAAQPTRGGWRREDLYDDQGR